MIKHIDAFHVGMAVCGLCMFVSAALFYMGIRSLRDLLKPIQIPLAGC